MVSMTPTLASGLIMLLGAIVIVRAVAWEHRDQYSGGQNALVGLIGIVIEIVGIGALLATGPAAPAGEVIVGVLVITFVALFFAILLFLVFEGFVYVYGGERDREESDIGSGNITIPQIGVGVIVILIVFTAGVLLLFNPLFSIVALLGGLLFLAPGALIRMSD